MDKPVTTNKSLVSFALHTWITTDCLLGGKGDFDYVFLLCNKLMIVLVGRVDVSFQRRTST